MNKHRFFSSISFVRISYKTIWHKTWSWYKNQLKNESWKGLNWCFPKDAHKKSEEGSVKSDLKKLDYFTLETSKNHLIRNFLRNGRLRVNVIRMRMSDYFLKVSDPFLKSGGRLFALCIKWLRLKPSAIWAWYLNLFLELNANAWLDQIFEPKFLP